MNEEAPRSGRSESADERADRNWVELLQELRVTQTGAQILTGFLLTLPFQQRFADLVPRQVVIYLVLVALAVLATLLMVAPVSVHRMLFGKQRKPATVSLGNALARYGLIALGLVLVGTALLVFDVVLGTTAGLIAAGSVTVLLIVLWLALPYGQRPHADD